MSSSPVFGIAFAIIPSTFPPHLLFSCLANSAEIALQNTTCDDMIDEFEELCDGIECIVKDEAGDRCYFEGESATIGPSYWSDFGGESATFPPDWTDLGGENATAQPFWSDLEGESMTAPPS